MFTSPHGGTLRIASFRPRFSNPAAKRADLIGLTPPELRHTAASLAVAAGANVKAVQQMLGHAAAAMTLDVYAGLFADDLKRSPTDWMRPCSILMRTSCGLAVESTGPNVSRKALQSPPKLC